MWMQPVRRWKLSLVVVAVAIVAATVIFVLARWDLGERDAPEQSGDETARARVVEMVDNLMRQSTVGFSKEQYGGKPDSFRTPVDNAKLRYAIDFDDRTYSLERELFHLEVYPNKEVSVDGRTYMQMAGGPERWVSGRADARVGGD